MHVSTSYKLTLRMHLATMCGLCAVHVVASVSVLVAVILLLVHAIILVIIGAAYHPPALSLLLLVGDAITCTMP